MIARPENLVFCEVNLWLNFRFYNTLEIDLKHINIGKKNTRRSCFTGEEVKEIFVELINNMNLLPESKKEYGDEFCDYFLKTGKYQLKEYKLVFCICSDRQKSIGVITLFRSRGKYESL